MDDEDLTQQIYAVDDAETGTLRPLATAHGSHAARVAHRLHRNLGHPRKEVLLKLLEGKQVSEKVREAIESLHRPHCQTTASRRVFPLLQLNVLKTSKVVQADVMWIELDKTCGNSFHG